MSTITTINATDYPADSRAVINTNFSNLNTDKAELASPVFTGTPTLPTGTIATTQSASNNSTKVATTAYVDNQASIITPETTAGTTHSLVTTAGQKVMVWAKGRFTSPNPNNWDQDLFIYLKYNGVTKDTVMTRIETDGNKFSVPFSLMYTETPGADTKNITVEVSTGTLDDNVVIMVMKIG